MKLLKTTTRLLLVASLLFSFMLSIALPATSHADSNSSPSKQDQKKKPAKKKSSKTTAKSVAVNVSVPFTTQNQNDPNLPEGQTEVLRAGQNGTVTKTYKVSYKNGKQTKKSLTSTKTKIAMVPQIIGVGTYVAPAPTPTPSVSDGNGATAQCADGSYSYAAHHQGACSHHGGVATWYR